MQYPQVSICNTRLCASKSHLFTDYVVHPGASDSSFPLMNYGADKLSTFERELKSHLFQSAFAVYLPCSGASDLSYDFGAI